MRIAIVLGTRPEIQKNYSIVRALVARGAPPLVLHTGQHVDPAMREQHFAELGYQPDLVQPGEYRIGTTVDWIQSLVRERRIDCLLVNGDTAAAFATAMAALYSDRRMAHVEAGLRSYDPYMLEERNRIVADTVADELFPYTEHAERYLRGCRELRGRIHRVGNTTVDLLHDLEPKLLAPRSDPYLLLTLHRRELTDCPERMGGVLRALDRAGRDVGRMVFPVHPRTRDQMRRAGLDAGKFPAIDFVDPMPTIEYLRHLRHARLAITDSGCVQEEAYLLGVPCVTVRENTERPETLECGANQLTGFDEARIESVIAEQLRIERGPYPSVYGTPGVGERIARILLEGSSERTTEVLGASAR